MNENEYFPLQSAAKDSASDDDHTLLRIRDDMIADAIDRVHSRSQRVIFAPNQDDMLVLAQLLRMTSDGSSVSRGAVVDAFAMQSDQNYLPMSTVFASIANCARSGLIEAEIDGESNRFSGRPVQKIKLTAFGREALRIHAEYLSVLQSAFSSRASPQALN